MSEMYPNRDSYIELGYGQGPAGWILPPEDLNFAEITDPGDRTDFSLEGDLPDIDEMVDLEPNPEQVLQDILETAGNTVSVYTDGPGGKRASGPAGIVRRQSNIWRDLPSSARLRDALDSGKASPVSTPVECIGFSLITEEIPQDTPAPLPKGGILNRWRPAPSAPPQATEKRPMTVTMPDGSKERIIETSYTFNPYLFGNNNPYNRGMRDGEVPPYNEYSTSRPGNAVEVSLWLPESHARTVLNSVRENPDFARQLMEGAFFMHAPEALREYWESGNPAKTNPTQHRLKPPYEQLPDSWKLFVYDGVSPLGTMHNVPTGSFDQTYNVSTVPFKPRRQ